MSDVTITFEGAPLSARPGESVAAALAGNGVLTLRQTRSGAERGMFCGMGVCQECLVEVDGRPNQRACMTKVAAGMAVRRNVEDRRAKPRPKPPATIDDIPVSEPEILVIGAGPGGLSAAIAARRAGAEVVVVDERSQPGGQYFKQLGVAGGAPADRQHQEGAAPDRSRAVARRKNPFRRAGLGRLRPARARREPRRPHAAPPPPAADRGDRRL